MAVQLATWANLAAMPVVGRMHKKKGRGTSTNKVANTKNKVAQLSLEVADKF